MSSRGQKEGELNYIKFFTKTVYKKEYFQLKQFIVVFVVTQ